MQALSEKVLGKLHFTLEQVQDLTPTPMTLSSVMFYMGMNPYTGETLYVARSQDDKRLQKSYFFASDGANHRSDKPMARGAKSTNEPRYSDRRENKSANSIATKGNARSGNRRQAIDFARKKTLKY